MPGEPVSEECETDSSGSDPDARLDALLRRLLELSAAAPHTAAPDVDLVLEELDELLAGRSLEGRSYRELFLQLRRPEGVKGGAGGVLVTATALDERGSPEPVGYAAGEGDVVQLTTQLLVDLRFRGLDSVDRVLVDATMGAVDVVTALFPDSECAEVPSGRLPSWLSYP